MHELERLAVTELWGRIFVIASEEFPALGMKAPGVKRTTSDWVVWKANLPPQVSLDWKIRWACVDLNFQRGCPQAPTASGAAHNLPNTRLVRTAGTVALRTALEVPEEPWTGISEAKIRQALQAAECLLTFYREMLAVTSAPASAPHHHPCKLELSK